MRPAEDWVLSVAEHTTREPNAEAFRGLTLRHRGRTGLTQRELAARLGVHVRTVQDWEAGLSHPATTHLRALIATFLQSGGFAEGRELAEARALWAAALSESPRLEEEPFDSLWFADMLSRWAVRSRRDALPKGQDWGDAPDPGRFVDRDAERAVLRQWVLEERSRLVGVVGLGGVGKTLVATRVAQELAPMFERVCWRSLRNAPSPAEWLARVVAFVAVDADRLANQESALLGQLLDLLRHTRCLLVLDNLESVLEPGQHEGRYRAGYEGYGTLLRQLGETWHQSCLVFTSREEPPELASLDGEGSSVRVLRLGGLDVDGGRSLLEDKQLSGDDVVWQELVTRYDGNALALRVVGARIREFFGGAIGPFLQYARSASGTSVGALRLVLKAQVEQRLSTLEQEVVRWLAIEREPVTLAELGPRVGHGAALEALEALRRRSLVERSAPGTGFTLQSVVLEYVTERLVEQVSQEIESGQPVLIERHPLVEAQAKDYVRRSQERLIALPLLEQLARASGSAAAAERLLLKLLESWRGVEPARHGYGPGNVVNLLRLLRGDLNGLDFSHLSIRQAYLQEVDAQGARMVGAQFVESVFAEAFDSPTRIALSADAAYLVAGTSRGVVCLWSLADQRLLLSIPAHVGPTYGIALSEDATLVASGSLDHAERVKVWSIPSGRLVASMEGGGGAWGVALSADNQMVASGHIDRTVRLWEVGSGRLLRTLEGHSGAVYGVALSLDGQLVVSSSNDGTVKVWEAPTGRLLQTLQGHSGGLRGLALSTDGRMVACGSQDGTVQLWDLPTGNLVMTFAGHTAGVYGVALATDRRLLASASFDGLVKVWDLTSGRLLATLHGHTAPVWCMALSRAGHLVASGGWDGTIKLWETESGLLLTTLQGHTAQLWGVALSGDGQRLVSGTQDGTVKLWDTDSGQLLRTLRKHASKVFGVAVSRDGKLVASGSWDQTVKVWDADSGRLLRTLAGHNGGVYGVALSDDASLAASGSYDGTVKLWDVQSGRLLVTLPHHSTQVWNVALSRDGTLVASGAEDGLVKLWDAQTGQFLRALQGDASPVLGVALTDDCQRVAIGHENGSLEFWDAEHGRVLATMVGHSGGIWGLALSTDGQLLISGSQDQTAKLWDTRSGQLRMTLTEHGGPVWGVALSADGRLVASASEDATVKLWEANTGVCLRTLRAERRYERMDITGLTGITDAQRQALMALGAVERTGVTDAERQTLFAHDAVARDT